MSTETVNKWISKYALTHGITYREGYINDYGHFRCKHYTGAIRKEFFHDTKEEAVLKAEEMKRGKIEKLKSQLAKVEQLKFDN